MGRVPVLSAAYGSLRSCECLLESKFVIKRDEAVWMNRAGEKLCLLSLSSDHQSREAGEILLSWHTNTHALTRHIHTYTCARTQKKKPHEIQLGSCILLQFFIFVIISWTASAFFPHLLYHQPHSDRPQQWRHGVKLNLTKPKPLPTRGAIGIRALSVNQNPPAPAHRHLPFGPTGRHENGMQI